MADGLHRCPDCEASLETLRSPELGRVSTYCNSCEQYYSVSSTFDGKNRIVPISEAEAYL
jgi:uncharacterized protein with PIN domain